MIEVKEITKKSDKKKFFKFQHTLYEDNEHAYSNLYMDEFEEFDPEENTAYRFADCRMFLAYKDDEIVGRIAAIWHRGANEKTGKKQLRFTRFDAIDDFEVTKALFKPIIEWAKELGMDEIIGPMSFSDLDEEGMLIDGFDRDSTYTEIYNYPYYVTHMEKLGAYKVVDWNCQRITLPEKYDGKYTKLAQTVKERGGYTILDVKYLLKHDKEKLKGYIMQALGVLDEAYAHLYGTSPIDDGQKEREMNSILSVLIPELACCVLKDDKVVSYGFMMPCIKEVMQKGKGHIIPFGLIPYIKAMKHVHTAEMMSIGVAKEHANKGTVAIIMDECLKGLETLGVKYLETGPELEYNNNIQNLWKDYNAETVKKHRCWGLKVE